jgi:hypothetical protein
MKESRKKELDFMMRIGTPIPIVESRPPKEMEEFFDDHFTVTELIQHGVFDFIGQNIQWLYIRPKQDFEVCIGSEIRRLTSGEIIILEMSENGKKEFKMWISGEEQ